MGVDIFSGAGGLSIGAEMVGIKTVIAVENDKHAYETCKFNHPNTEVICDDIRNVSLANKYKIHLFYLAVHHVKDSLHQIQKTRNTDNANNSLFYEYIRQVSELSPEWFVFENVEGITTFENGTVVKKLEELFKKLG